MSEVLVTGLAIGYEVGVCQSCNFDLSWLVTSPATLLWADRILVSPVIVEQLESGEYMPEQPELSRCLQLFAQMSRAEGIIKVVEPATLIPQEMAGAIVDQAARDVDRLPDAFPDIAFRGDREQVPGQLFLNDQEYCTPFVSTIYATLLLARAVNAQCLFDERSLNYCRYKFALDGPYPSAAAGLAQAFASVLESALPDLELFPGYVRFRDHQCCKCRNRTQCADGYLTEMEDNLKQLLEWRSYDELRQLVAVVDSVVTEYSDLDEAVDANEIRRDVADRARHARRRLRSVFPKVERWADITTILSIPLVVVGAATTNPLIVASGVGLAGLAQVGKKTLDVLRAKARWVGLLGDPTNTWPSHREAFPIPPRGKA